MSNEETNNQAAEAATEVGADVATQAQTADGADAPMTLEQILSGLRREAVKPADPEPKDQLLSDINAIGEKLTELLVRAGNHASATVDNINYELRDFRGEREDLPQHVKDFERANVGGWLNQAAANLATGLMQLRRSVERPTHF